MSRKYYTQGAPSKNSCKKKANIGAAWMFDKGLFKLINEPTQKSTKSKVYEHPHKKTKLTDEQVDEARYLYEKVSWTRRMVMEKFNLTDDYCKKLLSYEIRSVRKFERRR